MIQLKARIVGVEGVESGLYGWSQKTWERVRRAVAALGIELQGIVKRDFLTGQSLNVRSGRLRRSITQAMTEDPTHITSRTGTNVEYSAFWELGYHGQVKVRAHMRRVKSRDVRRTVEDESGNRRRRVVSVGGVQVRAHTRQVDQEPRPFLQPALAQMRTKIITKLDGALKEK